MRCRPDDLAMVVNDLQYPENNGKFVTVLRRAFPQDYDGPIDWECRAESHLFLSGVHISPGESGAGYLDRELMPIRDPGDDATDETLEWLPVPGKAVTA